MLSFYSVRYRKPGLPLVSKLRLKPFCSGALMSIRSELHNFGLQFVVQSPRPNTISTCEGLFSRIFSSALFSLHAYMLYSMAGTVFMSYIGIKRAFVPQKNIKAQRHCHYRSGIIDCINVDKVFHYFWPKQCSQRIFGFSTTS